VPCTDANSNDDGAASYQCLALGQDSLGSATGTLTTTTTCVASTLLKFYRYALVGATCADGGARCYDEAGVAVDAAS